jgi:uncharacterized protein (DUF983 family)
MKTITLPQPQTVVWQPDRAGPESAWPMPKLGTALLRGLAGRCPACGVGKLFRGYLRVQNTCAACDAPLGLVRADDAPPYFTIVVVGHLIVPGMLMLERNVTPPLWVHAAIWLPLTAMLSLALLRPIKGATVGLMLKLGIFRGPDA